MASFGIDSLLILNRSSSNLTLLKGQDQLFVTSQIARAGFGLLEIFGVTILGVTIQ